MRRGLTPAFGITGEIFLYWGHEVWLDRLKASLGKELCIHSLKIDIAFPYELSGHHESPTAVSIRFQGAIAL
jgi:hypothetical protein